MTKYILTLRTGKIFIEDHKGNEVGRLSITGVVHVNDNEKLKADIVRWLNQANSKQEVSDFKIRVGLELVDKNTGKTITVKRKASGNKHWTCSCDNKTHKIHEGTLHKYYEVKQEGK